MGHITTQWVLNSWFNINDFLILDVYLNAAWLWSVLMCVRVNIRTFAFKHWSERAVRARADGNGKRHQLTHSKTLVSRCCFHCFQVSLVNKFTQIIHTNVPDTFITCNWHAPVEYLLYRNGFVSSKKSVSISTSFRRGKLGLT